MQDRNRRRSLLAGGSLVVLLVLVSLAMAMPATAIAEGGTEADGPAIVEDFDPVDPGLPPLDLAVEPITLTSTTADAGGAFRYVDHVALPDYARNLYDWLVEATDDDGEEDWLIWDEGFQPSSGDYHEADKTAGALIPIWNGYSVSLGPVGSLTSEDVSGPIYDAIAVFEYDHPECFWAVWPSAHSVLSDSDGNNYAVYVLKGSAEGEHYDCRYPDYRSESAIRSAIAQRDERVDELFLATRAMGATTYSRVREFDDWLTHHNQYNVLVDNDMDPLNYDVYECISALSGRSGDEGPVCAGYAKALKVLCDRAGIGCVYVSGMSHGEKPGRHAWNLVEVGNGWYAVDATWDDPTPWEGAPPDRGPVSGRENTDYLLVGSGTVIDDRRFDASHVAWEGDSPAFPGIPLLSTMAYDPSMAPRQVDIGGASIEVAGGSAYTGGPSEPDVTVTYRGRTLRPEVEYFLEYSDNVDAGTASVTVTGMEGFTGTSAVPFRIDRAMPELTLDPTSLLLEPGDGAATVEVLGNDGLEVSAVSSDPKVCGVKQSGPDGATLAVTPLRAGDAEVGVRVEGDANHYPAEATLPVTVEELVEVWRLYNGTTGEHLFTDDANEYRTLGATAAWAGEGVAWMAPAHGTSVYRVYNPNTGEHLYTRDARERAALTGGGWSDEGHCWFSDDAERVPVMRLYNRWSAAASHLYTQDSNEYDQLASIGWSREGVCWYAASR